jgi:hypothetical protein
VYCWKNQTITRMVIPLLLPPISGPDAEGQAHASAPTLIEFPRRYLTHKQRLVVTAILVIWRAPVFGPDENSDSCGHWSLISYEDLSSVHPRSSFTTARAPSILLLGLFVTWGWGDIRLYTSRHLVRKCNMDAVIMICICKIARYQRLNYLKRHRTKMQAKNTPRFSFVLP